MSYLVTSPEALTATAADVQRIGSALRAAAGEASGPTTGVAAAAEDEVSLAIARLFGAFGQQYQAVLTDAAAFHSQFTQTLSAASTTYAQAETAAAGLVSGEVAPLRALLSPTTGGALESVSRFPPLSTTLISPVTALIMGGAHNPGPIPSYIAAVDSAYIQPVVAGAAALGVYTPEQFWPATPELGNTLTFGQSVAQGVSLLNSAINTQLTAGHSALVFGYSESATVATNEIRALMALPLAQQPTAGQLAFTLVGDPNNPVGGLLERFPGFYVPGLDVAFNGATPQSPWATSIYTIQYDGFADFPQYPLNFLSDLNSLMGISLHSDYPWLTANQVANAVLLPTSGGNTNYYMFMTQNLPLLDPIRQIPYVGNPLADLVQPDLRVIVDMGYADYGAGANYANVPTPAGLFAIPNPFTVIPDLGTGAVQGVQAALVDVGALPQSALPNAYPYVPSLDPGLNVSFGQSSATLLSVLSGDVGSVLELIPPPNLS
ncbi:PE family protein [Mycobacterium parmense]|uniref:PE family protein PE4 n=1 Tax=Mycobacterium parmense TaxID=185642 RepID=A0A7I7Z061_9MYCO|nr:PE-PPE domain-containing protein [Mycobacterium parmense]MCV7350085.1 PE-PPE domain-containing protein [Mycobacterium parmense]ORW59352.1 PE family protein [Mycobacterium parmense]BBZ46381.1 PE family protein PE4 [Mycobacterium parmense]